MIADRWRDAWTGEVAWMSVEAARMAGRAPDTDSLATLSKIVTQTRAYDAGNDRLARWSVSLQ
jgi:hypothetical protein